MTPPDQAQGLPPEPAGASDRRSGWDDIWKGRQVSAEGTPSLPDLLRADGYDTGFGDVDERAWEEYVSGWMDNLGVSPAMSVYEVGCGAGAFLYPFYQRGCTVGGVDLSASLIALARAVMPEGNFSVGDAKEAVSSARADVLLSVGVFMYFPSPEYSWDVLGTMAAAAQHAVLVLDLPDRTREVEERESRIAALGSPAEYAERYRGLGHQRYDRTEMAEFLSAQGYTDVSTADVTLRNYVNGAFRFNLCGFRVR